MTFEPGTSRVADVRHTRKPIRTRPPLRRILWFDREVRAGRYPNAPTLAEEFEVHIRTAYRDIDYLRCQLRAPLEYDAGQRGYWYADQTFALPALTITEGELLALFIGEQVLRQYRGTPYEAALRSAFQKIVEALPDSVSLDLSGWGESYSFTPGPTIAQDLEMFQRLAEAIHRRQQLQIRYYTQSRDEETVRVIEPYHLHNRGGDWYLIAYDHLRGDIREFAPSRIRSLRQTGRTFRRREGFDLQGYLAQAFGVVRGEKPIRVSIRFSPYQARWIREKTWHPSQELEELDDGGLVLKLRVPLTDELIRWVLSFGPEAEVLRPKALAKEILRRAQEVSARYRKETHQPGRRVAVEG